tara:strand:- start:3485 stop:3958 length:474 start_codon:yes stop_codon:yes gene_type:complete
MDNRDVRNPSSGCWISNVHKLRIRVYYDSTDAGGIVYHSQYLSFAEHARTESLRLCGINQINILENQGVAFAVRHCAIDFKQPARLDDLIEVQTIFCSMSGARIQAKQTIFKVQNNILDVNWLAQLDVNLACINNRGRATRFPAQVRRVILDTITNT